ncbi:MAG: hypothetical protein ACOCQG_04495 [Candidatus Nanoarchaeia archaeon]
MQIKNYIEKVENSVAYNEWMKSNTDYYLVHVFLMSEKPVQVGYYSKEHDKIVTFNIGAGEVSRNEPEESFKEGGEIENLDISNVMIDIEDARTECEKLRKEKYSQEVVDKEMIILQTLDGEPTYNITLITKAFNFINIKMKAQDKTIKEEKKSSILDLKK